jgi:regulator of protease activity HflC (stomatin/prohibitin superfamily)
MSNGRSGGSGASLSQVQNILRLTVWVVVFIVFLAIIGIPLSSVLPTLYAVAAAAVVGFLVAWVLSSTIYVLPEFQRAILLRMGSYEDTKGPGFFMAIPWPPFYHSVAQILDMRIHSRPVKAAETLTSDNVPVDCQAVIFYRVEDPKQASLEVKNYEEAVFHAANAALKDIIGSLSLSELLSEREKVAGRLEHIVDQSTVEFGVDITSVELTDVQVPQGLIEDISAQAQAERERDARVAEVERITEVADIFENAAQRMSERAMRLYELQALQNVAKERGARTVIWGIGPHREAQRLAAGAAAGPSELERNEQE